MVICHYQSFHGHVLGFPGGWAVKKNLPAMQEIQEIWVQSLDQEDTREEETATHSNILASKIPWTEKPDGLQFVGSLRIIHDGAHTQGHILSA